MAKTKTVEKPKAKSVTSKKPTKPETKPETKLSKFGREVKKMTSE